MKKEEKSTEKTSVKQPPPPPQYSKNKAKNIKKIKLSARAKELIYTSLLTAKARATDFVETKDGLKPAEEVKKLEEMNKENGSTCTYDLFILISGIYFFFYLDKANLMCAF